MLFLVMFMKAWTLLIKICKDVKVEDNNGTVKKENQPVIESIRCKKI